MKYYLSDLVDFAAAGCTTCKYIPIHFALQLQTETLSAFVHHDNAAP